MTVRFWDDFMTEEGLVAELYVRQSVKDYLGKPR